MTTTLGDEAGATRQVELAVGGMTCAACATRVERKLNKLDGVQAIVNYATGRASVDATPGADDASLVDIVCKAGYQAEVIRPDIDQESDSGSRARDLWRRMLVSVILFVPLCDLSILFMVLPSTRFTGWQWLLVALTLPVAGWAAWPFHRAALRNARHGSSSMDTLVSIGIAAAGGWSLYAMFFQAAPSGEVGGLWSLLHSEGALYLEVAAGVTTFVLAGRYFEARAGRSAGDALRKLAALSTKDVTVVLDDGSEQAIASEELRQGQRFLVRPGETIATDGRVADGQAAIDSSAMTGESAPAEVTAGDEVLGGTVALTGRLVVEATYVGQDTRLAAMVRLVEQAQNGKAAVQRLADRIAGYFVPGVLVLAGLTLLGWLLWGDSVEQAMAAALAVLVIACPCALGLATPTALMVASGRGAQLGIFIKGYQALESTRNIDTVVLDKTGTVTAGQMSVVRVESTIEHATALRLAGALEAASEHAVAAAITTRAREEVGTLPPVERFVSKPGLGAAGTVEEHDVLVGRAKLFQDSDWPIPKGLDRQRHEWEQQGRTAVLLGRDGEVVAMLALADLVRPFAPRMVAELHRLGLRTLLCSGDNASTAHAVAEKVGIDEVRAEVLPDQKVEVVRRLQAEGRAVAVVGDGVNDAPALVTADLGLAVGAGTDSAINAADLILVRDDLTVVAEAIKLARSTLRTIRGNLVWAFGYNFAAIPLAAAGLLNPLIAAAAMALSSGFVVSNSMRLRRFTGERSADAPPFNVGRKRVDSAHEAIGGMHSGR